MRAAFPVICVILLVSDGIGCSGPEYRRLAEIGATGKADDWRSIGFTRPVGDEEVIRAVPDLKRIRVREVHLAARHVSDRIIPYLTQLDSLEVLDLSGTDVTAQGMHGLAKLPKLKHL